MIQQYATKRIYNSDFFDNMDILSLRLFLRVAENGRLTVAARDLSLSAASASARLNKLESLLGFQLFNRTTRSISLTTDGAAFLPYAQQVIETLDVGVGLVLGGRENVGGLLRIAMPGSFGRMHVIPLLAEFHAQYPKIKFDLRLSDEFIDITEGGYDMSIRNAPLEDSSMVAKELAPDRRLLVASPDYLEKHGAPGTPHELAEHRLVALAGNNLIKFKNGDIVTVPTFCSVNDGEAMRMLLEQGFGIGIKSQWNASKSMNLGKLIEVMPDFPILTESSVWIIYPKGRIAIPKVRVTIDFLRKKFSPIPPWS